MEIAAFIECKIQCTAGLNEQWFPRSDHWGLWFLTSLLTIFQLYRGGQFDWWRKPEKTRHVVSSTSHHEQIRTHVSGDKH